MYANKSAQTDIFIVGAGPTGLMLACQLARFRVNFRIIEKNSGPTTQSRALAIHAASMEIFSQMGIADNFLKPGKQVKAINYFVKGKVERRIPLSEFGKGLTQFPFLLTLEQSKTERILIDFLEKQGHKVEWQTELIDFTQSTENIQISLRSPDGEENIKADWLIGADGAKSRVRQTLNIPFGGETYPVDLFVLDCKVNWDLKEDEMYIAFSDYSFAGFFPMPEGRCRVIGFVPENVSSKENVRFEDINNGFSDRMQMNIELYDPDWISMYHSHHRYVSNFKLGRCFLTGDAAHIHSPVGAQGMNTGLQDAYNLAWKLALVVKKQAPENLLSTYQDERLPFAKKLVQSTDRAFGITVSQNPLIKYARMHVAPHILAMLLKIKPIERFLFKSISQIGITYPNSILSRDSSGSDFPSNAPKPGERLPFAAYENAAGKRINIQQQVNGLSLQLFIFSGSSGNISMELMELSTEYNNLITYEIIKLNNGTEKLYKLLGIKQKGLYLIRPDLYITYRSTNFGTKNLRQHILLFTMTAYPFQ